MKKVLILTDRQAADYSRHNYAREVAALVVSAVLTRGEVYAVDILHDDGCAIWKGGYCDCNPAVSVSPAGRAE